MELPVQNPATAGYKNKLWNQFFVENEEKEECFAEYAKLIHNIISSNPLLEYSLFSKEDEIASTLSTLCSLLYDYIHTCRNCGEDLSEVDRMFPSRILGPNTFLDLPRSPYGLSGVAIEGFYLEFFKDPVARKKILRLGPCSCLYVDVDGASETVNKKEKTARSVSE